MLQVTLPGPNTFTLTAPKGFSSQYTNLGSLLSGLLTVAFFIAGFLMVIWLAWGVFQYIFAGGNKDALAKARGRITWALVGFVILIVSFMISEYVRTIIPENINQKVKQITTP